MPLTTGDLPESPVVRRAARLAEDLSARATDLERTGVDRPLRDRMGAAGLLAVSGPPELGVRAATLTALVATG